MDSVVRNGQETVRAAGSPHICHISMYYRCHPRAARLQRPTWILLAMFGIGYHQFDGDTRPFVAVDTADSVDLTCVTRPNQSPSWGPPPQPLRLSHCTRFDSHAKPVAKACAHHTHDLRHVRHWLNSPQQSRAVMSRHGSTTAILYYTVHQQRRSIHFSVFKHLACARCSSAKPLLESLHWLPVRPRVTYKLATVCYKARSTSTPVTALTTCLLSTTAVKPRTEARHSSN